MNLAHLYYFRKLVELGSYSMAAKELYIAQPTLSLAISNIEKELSAVLVKKKRGNLELTVDGKELFEAAVIATNAVDNAVSLFTREELVRKENCASDRCIQSRVKLGQRLYVRAGSEQTSMLKLVGSKERLSL